MKCLYCDKEKVNYSLYELLFDEDLLCLDCRKKMNYHHQKFIVDGINFESFYDYDSLYKDLLLQYKECYDEALKDIFLYKIDDYLKLKYIGYQILYIPSTSDKLNERGFNHLKEIFKVLGFKEVKGLKMKEELSQYGKNYKERSEMSNNYLYQGEHIKRLLIVDDVYTTGSSLKGVIRATKGHADKIKALILAKKYFSEKVIIERIIMIQ